VDGGDGGGWWREELWQGGNGGKLSRMVAMVAVGGKKRARLQMQAHCGFRQMLQMIRLTWQME
jgi:hypothetical protein